MQLSPNTLKFLKKSYKQPHRHYHTLEHVNTVLDTIRNHEKLFMNPLAAYLAAWFHDVVYAVGDEYKFNEERSARAMLSWIEDEHKEFYDSAEGYNACTQALRMIGATHGHGFETVRGSYMLSTEEITDIGLFLDADLRILSGSQEEVLKFEENIRKEFSIYDDLVYNSTRKQILESFLGRKKIYFTNMGEPWEQAARDNLKLLIERLK